MRKYSNDKDINKKVKDLLKFGWRFKTGKKHSAIISPNGFRLSISSTPSDRRSIYNFNRDICHLSRQVLPYAS